MAHRVTHVFSEMRRQEATTTVLMEQRSGKSIASQKADLVRTCAVVRIRCPHRASVDEMVGVRESCPDRFSIAWARANKLPACADGAAYNDFGKIGEA